MTQEGAIRVHDQSLQRLYFPGQCFSPLQLFSSSSCPPLGRAADLFTTKYQARRFQAFKQQDVTEKLPRRETIASRTKSYLALGCKRGGGLRRGAQGGLGTRPLSAAAPAEHRRSPTAQILSTA